MNNDTTSNEHMCPFELTLLFFEAEINKRKCVFNAALAVLTSNRFEKLAEPLLRCRIAESHSLTGSGEAVFQPYALWVVRTYEGGYRRSNGESRRGRSLFHHWT